MPPEPFPPLPLLLPLLLPPLPPPLPLPSSSSSSEVHPHSRLRPGQGNRTLPAVAVAAVSSAASVSVSAVVSAVDYILDYILAVDCILAVVDCILAVGYILGYILAVDIHVDCASGKTAASSLARDSCRLPSSSSWEAWVEGAWVGEAAQRKGRRKSTWEVEAAWAEEEERRRNERPLSPL